MVSDTRRQEGHTVSGFRSNFCRHAHDFRLLLEGRRDKRLSSICVGSRCPWVRSNIGAVATQNITLPAIGSKVLDKITDGLTAQKALDNVLSQLTDIEYRQVAVIDRKGGTAGFSGKKMLGINAIATGKQCIAAVIC